MSAVATDTGAAVLALLEREACAINMTGRVQLLPDHPEPEIKRLVNDLYMQREICRIQVMGVRDRYYAFFALSVRPVRGQVLEQLEAPAPAALPVVLSPEQAVNVLESAGWKAEPEVVEPIGPAMIERRAQDRRRLTAFEVIRRWRLPYPLARVVEIIADSRKRGISRDDAALAIKMLREHVRGDE